MKLYFINSHMEWLEECPEEVYLCDDPLTPNKYCPASAEQQAFKEAHPDASTEEVLTLTLKEPEEEMN